MLLDEKVINMEKNMWEAFSNGDSTSFAQLVSDEAIMICGGYKTTGAEYAKIVEQIRLQDYEVSDFFVKEISANTILVNYLAKVKCPDPSISGIFRVSSLWVNDNDKLKLLFNQDSRIG